MSRSKRIGMLGMAAHFLAFGMQGFGDTVTPTYTPKIQRNVPCPNPDQRRYAKGMQHIELEFEHANGGYVYSCIVLVSGGSKKALTKEASKLDKMLCHFINMNTHDKILETGYFTVIEQTA